MPIPPKKRVSIIVLNYNKKDDLLDCLHSVYKMDFSSFKVFVVDNGSTDGSVEAVRKIFPDSVLVINKKNIGVSSGRNSGLKAAQTYWKSEYVLFLDNDSIVHKKYLTILYESIQKKRNCGFICGKGYMPNNSNVVQSIGLHVNFYLGIITDIGAGEEDHGQFNIERQIDACPGFGFLTKMSLIRKLNGFNTLFNPYGWEEIDLCNRGKKLGFNSFYEPNAIIYHKGTKMGRGPVPTYEESKMKNLFKLMHCQASTFQRFIFYCTLPLRGSILLMRNLLTGNFLIVKAHLRGILKILFFNKKEKKNEPVK